MPQRCAVPHEVTRTQARGDTEAAAVGAAFVAASVSARRTAGSTVLPDLVADAGVWACCQAQGVIYPLCRLVHLQ